LDYTIIYAIMEKIEEKTKKCTILHQIMCEVTLDIALKQDTEEDWLIKLLCWY